MEIENTELLIRVPDSEIHNSKECEHELCSPCLFCVGGICVITFLLVLSYIELWI